MMVVVGKVKGRSGHLEADSGFCNWDLGRSPCAAVGHTGHCISAHRGHLGQNTHHDLRLGLDWGFPSRCEPIEMTRGEDAWVADRAPDLTVTYLVAFAAVPV